MSDAFFTDLGDGRFRAEEACGGPWSPDLMHGGPPSALLVRACERAVGRSGSRSAASIEFLSAVPVGPVNVSARVVRGGRRIALTEAVHEADGREVLHARVWNVRDGRGADSRARPATPTDVPGPGRSPTTMTDWTFPYATPWSGGSCAATRAAPAPATVWSHARIPVVPGEQPGGLQRAVLRADSGNGISAGLDWAAWSFVNIDLDVHLSRPLVGEWVLLDAPTRYEERGDGRSRRPRLWDERGRVGRGAQTLVIFFCGTRRGLGVTTGHDRSAVPAPRAELRSGHASAASRPGPVDSTCR